MHSVKGGDLEQRECELVILRVACRMKAWYEWAAHVDRGLAAGLSLQEIYRIASGPASDGWSDKDALLLSAVDQLLDEHSIDRATTAALAGFFSARQTMDIISLQGLYVTIACMIGTWPVEIEDSVVERLPSEVTEEAFNKLLLATHSD